SENDFEKVRSTSTLSQRRTRSTALASAKSTYASSTTSNPMTRCASASMASSGTGVPEGELGWQTTVTRPAASAKPAGSEKSAGYWTWTAAPSWMVTRVSYRL